MAITKLVGDVVNVTVPVRNIGTLSGTAYVRVALVQTGSAGYLDVIDTATGTIESVVPLDPGQTAHINFSVTIPPGTPLGLYDTICVITSGPGSTGVSLASKEEADQVEITGEFTVEILEMFES